MIKEILSNVARKPKAVDIWKQMNPPSLRRLAVAVFLMFGTLGPLMILMQSSMEPMSWNFIVIQTACCGGMSASLILFARKYWWVTILIVSFWVGILVLNSGELNVEYNPDGGWRVHLGEPNTSGQGDRSLRSVTLTPDQLKDLYTQKAQIGLMAIGFLAFGYSMFIRVIRTEIRQRARLETEVSIAHDIQLSLLPSEVLTNTWCTVAGMTIPATEVGGDYYDIVELDSNRVAVAIADVTGHGVGAGLLSAMTKSAFRSQLQHDSSPANLLSNLNKTLYEVSGKNMFVTFAYILLDYSARSAYVATAGHPPVIFKCGTASEPKQLRTVSLGLGIQQNSSYSQVLAPFNPRDMFLLYTDGAIEALNAKGEQFGIGQIEQSFSSASGTVGEICSQVSRDVKDFAHTEILQDDLSIVCIKLS